MNNASDIKNLFDACTAPCLAFAAKIEAQVRSDARYAAIIARHPAPQEFIDQIVQQAWLDAHHDERLAQVAA